jgi:hypothetical protein
MLPVADQPHTSNTDSRMFLRNTASVKLLALTRRTQRSDFLHKVRNPQVSAFYAPQNLSQSGSLWGRNLLLTPLFRNIFHL